jgi:hypothetical protein
MIVSSRSRVPCRFVGLDASQRGRDFGEGEVGSTRVDRRAQVAGGSLARLECLGGALGVEGARMHLAVGITKPNVVHLPAVTLADAAPDFGRPVLPHCRRPRAVVWAMLTT